MNHNILFQTNPIEATQTPEQVAAFAKKNLDTASQIFQSLRLLGQQTDASVTWDAVMEQVDNFILALTTASEISQLLSLVHPNAEVRKVAEGILPQVEKLDTEFFLDSHVASLVKKCDEQKIADTVARKKFLAHILREFRRNGLELSEEKRNELRKLNAELTQLGQDFEKNISESGDAIFVSPDVLASLPEGFQKTHLPDSSGLVRISTDYPDYFPFLQYSEDRAAALLLFKKFNNRATEKNLPILDRLLVLREQKAHLLGYENWAAYVLETKMAKTPEIVMKFLESMKNRIAPLVEREMRECLSVYRELGNTDVQIPASYRLYLEEKFRQKNIGLDSKKLSEYFPLARVKQGILDVTAELFGLQFKKTSSPIVWHEDVELLEVSDKNNVILGQIFFDLHPRENKYKHAAMFGVRSTKTLQDGSRLVPMVALVCNFPKDTSEAPALMTHEEVCTFFHEFGHALHGVLSKATLATFQGTNVARDFVEAPSQMLEEWAWDSKSLSRFAKHYKTDEVIPEEMMAKLLVSRRIGLGLDIERQLYLATFDMTIHTRPAGLDTTALMKELHEKMIHFAFAEGTHFQASFGHLVGYEANYYGYQWALAIAHDLFTKFESADVMSAKVGALYKENILEPGGDREETDSVHAFLGREFSEESYAKFLRGE